MTRLESHLKAIRSKITKDAGFDYHNQLIDNSFKCFVTPGTFKNVLDVGFGTGYSLKKFKEAGIKVTGITMNDEEMKAATGHDVKIMDMAMLDFEDETFDFIWCRHALEHSVMPFIALLEFYRVLQEGGFVYIEVPSDCIFSIENTSHYSLFRDEAWHALFEKAGFSVKYRGQYALKKNTAPNTDHDVMFSDNYWYYALRKEIK